MADNIAQENIMNDTRTFLYDLIREDITPQRKNAEGKRSFDTFFCRSAIWEAPSHIKENIHNVYIEMIEAGFMELNEEPRSKTAGYLATRVASQKNEPVGSLFRPKGRGIRPPEIKEDKKNGLHKFAITESGYNEVTGLNKKRVEKTIKSGNTIIAGGSAKININSIDNSIINNITLNEQLKVFDDLAKAAASIPNNDEILRSIAEMKAAFERNDKTFKEKYNDFIQSVASHMTVFTPYISALTNLL